MFQMLGVFAEFERAMIVSRVLQHFVDFLQRFIEVAVTLKQERR